MAEKDRRRVKWADRKIDRKIDRKRAKQTE
jgi:hypothetical protein